MGDANQSGMKVVPEFQEDSRAPLIELENTDSTELWLIQWPKDRVPDFDGQQVALDLHHDATQLGSFQSSSGKSYDVVSIAAQDPATVFLSSTEGSNIVGKITRRVSFVHYLEPSEVPKDDTKKLKQFNEKSSAISLTNSAYNFVTPTKSARPAPSSGRTTTHSSGRRSSLSEVKVRSKDSKPSRSGHDSEHSGEKSKKRKKHVA